MTEHRRKRDSYLSGRSLHHTEGGICESEILSDNVYRYAKALCYLADPSTIRMRVIERFGYAPSLDMVRTMRTSYLEARGRIAASSEALGKLDTDAREYKVPGIPQKITYKQALVRYYENNPGANDDAETEIEPEPDNDNKPAPNYAAMVSSDIIRMIATEMGTTYEEVVGRSRKPVIVLARRTCMQVFTARGNSAAQTGRWLGVDHSSVLHGLKQFKYHATPKMRSIAAKFIRGKAVWIDPDSITDAATAAPMSRAL